MYSRGAKREVLLRCCMAGLLVTAGCSGSVAIPGAYKNYNAKDQSFAIDYPDGWDAVGGGQSGYHSARFTSASASIKVSADMVGSLFGDMAESRNRLGGTQDVEELKPVNQVHEMGKAQMADEWGNYQEQAATALSTSFGEARLSEFTAGSGFGGKYHGYRLTALSTERRITVVSYGKESDWQKLKPVFDKCNASLARGH